MTIGIHPRFEEGKPLTIFQRFFLQAIITLAKEHPEHTITIYGFPGEGNQQLPVNIKIEQRPVKKQGWLSTLFKKSKGDHEQSIIEIFSAAHRTTAGAVLVIADLAPVTAPSVFDKKQAASFSKSLRSSLRVAKAVIVPSNFYRRHLIQAFAVDEAMIRVINFKNEMRGNSFTTEYKQRIKENYTRGKEYFLFAGDLDPRFDFVLLLKSFSLFKKWQRSNMQLVMATSGAGAAITEELLSSYKYREELVWLKDPSRADFQELTTAAYAFIYPARYDPFPLPLFNAMKSELPVVAFEIPEIRELAGDSIVYSKQNESELSAWMQKMYKDETWHQEMAAKARAHAGIIASSASHGQDSLLVYDLVAK